MIPRAFISVEGHVHYTQSEGSQTFDEIYRGPFSERYLVAELPSGVILSTDMWAARRQQRRDRPDQIIIGPAKLYTTIEQAVMATVLTIGNSTDRMSMLTPWTVKYGVTTIDERKLQCRISLKPA